MLKGKINFSFSGGDNPGDALQKVANDLPKMFENELELAKSEIKVDWIGLELDVKVKSSRVVGSAIASLDLEDTEDNQKTFNCLMNGLSGWVHDTLGPASIMAGAPYSALEMWCEDVSDSTTGHDPDAPVVTRKRRWYDFLLGR